MSDLKKKFQQEISSKLRESLGLRNPNSTPRLSKIVLNMGVKDALLSQKNLDEAVKAMMLVSGQKPKVTIAKRAISSFKLRKGDAIGVMATLHGKRMYDFFEKLVTIVLPRLRDFHGTSSKSIDENGNYTLGLKEFVVFPEIDLSKIDKARGLEITIVTTTKDKKHTKELLKALGMPFREEEI